MNKQRLAGLSSCTKVTLLPKCATLARWSRLLLLWHWRRERRMLSCMETRLRKLSPFMQWWPNREASTPLLNTSRWAPAYVPPQQCGGKLWSDGEWQGPKMLGMMKQWWSGVSEHLWLVFGVACCCECTVPILLSRALLCYNCCFMFH